MTIRKSARKSSPLYVRGRAAVRCDARHHPLPHPSAGFPRSFPPLPLHLLPWLNESSLSNSTAFSGLATAGFSRPNHPNHPNHPSQLPRPSIRPPVTALREPLCFSVPPPRWRPTRAVISHLSSYPIPLPTNPPSPRPRRAMPRAPDARNYIEFPLTMGERGRVCGSRGSN